MKRSTGKKIEKNFMKKVNSIKVVMEISTWGITKNIVKQTKKKLKLETWRGTL